MLPEAIGEAESRKARRTIYTDRKLQAAGSNMEKYDWAAQLRDTAVRKADTYLAKGDDFLWAIVPPQALPRSYAVNEKMGSPVTGKAIDKFGVYPYLGDPLAEQWKIIDPSSGYTFPTNDFGAYYASGMDDSGTFRPDLANRDLLVNTLYPEKGAGWGVDDGFGWRDDQGNRYTFIAYYVHRFIWYGESNAIIPGAIRSLRDAYLYTGDPAYARSGLILLDRVADVYPQLDIFPFDRQVFLNSHGGSWGGKAVGSIWEAQLVKDFLSAYDAFFPAADDLQTVEFLSEKAKAYKLNNPKNSGAAIRRNIEDGIVAQVYPAVTSGRILGNLGMHESALVMAAVVQDKLPETKEWLDFVFRTGEIAYHPLRVTGGNIGPTLVNLVDRDGFGDEASPEYNYYWLGQFRLIADMLDGYDLYPEVDLYRHVKIKQMFSNFHRLLLSRRYIPTIGDSGKTGDPGVWLNIDHVIKAFEAYAEQEYAQVAYLLSGTQAKDLHGDIYSFDPEETGRKIAETIRRCGPLDLKSTNLTGYGFAALRDGNNQENSFRDLWMYYGRTTGHGHADALNIGLHAFGLDLAPDLGYPEYTDSSDMHRWQWVRNTISHNTVVVDKSQQSDQWIAQPKHFDDCERVKLIDVEASGVYPQTELYRRTTAMIKIDATNSYIVDFFRVKGGHDHHFSFHGAEGAVCTEGLNLARQTAGTYAGPNVGFGQRSDDIEGPGYKGSGFHYLKNVERDLAPGKAFSVDWQIADTWGALPQEEDIRLRLTMLGDFDEVALADGIPPQTQPGNPLSLRYLIAHRHGRNLNSLFASVIEPYNGQRSLTSVESASVYANGVEVNDTEAKAIKVTLMDGRNDYIISALDPHVRYTIDNKIEFQAFFGLFSEKAGAEVYSYVNEGCYIGPVNGARRTYAANLSGTIDDFSRTLTINNHIDANMSLNGLAVEQLKGKWIYVTNDGVRNASYEIKAIAALGGEKFRLDIGSVTLVRAFADPADGSKGYVYDIAPGASFVIPLSHERPDNSIF